MAPKKKQTMSLEDYAALPPSIQRKYFSSSERLRIFQQAAAQKRKKAPPPPVNTSWLASATTSTTSLTSAQSASTAKKLQKKRTLSTIRASSLTPVNEPLIETDQTDWFLNLPEKVKKQRFSQEEQACFAAKEGERAAQVTSPGLSSSAEEESSSYFPASSATSPRSSIGLTESIDEVHSDLDSDFDLETPAVTSTATEMEIFRMYNRRRSRIMNPEPIHIPPPEPKTLITPALSTAHPLRRTLRQRLSLVPIPLPPPTLAPPPGSAPTPNFSRPGITREFSASQSPFLSPDARYYRDPQTRRQLKACLAAGPERFDETIEFGFPTSIQPVELPANEIPPRTTSASSSAWSSETKKDDYGYDTDSFSSSDGPVTPTAGVGEGEGACEPSRLRLSSFSDDNNNVHARSSDHSAELEVPNSPSSPSYEGGVREKREMTLRMTLTRSGLLREETAGEALALRSAGARDATAAAQCRNPGAVEMEVPRDPLRLERLPVICEDVTGAGGAFAPPRGKGSGRGNGRGEKRLGRMLSRLKI